MLNCCAFTTSSAAQQLLEANLVKRGHRCGVLLLPLNEGSLRHKHSAALNSTTLALSLSAVTSLLPNYPALVVKHLFTTLHNTTAWALQLATAWRCLSTTCTSPSLSSMGRHQRWRCCACCWTGEDCTKGARVLGRGVNRLALCVRGSSCIKSSIQHVTVINGTLVTKRLLCLPALNHSPLAGRAWPGAVCSIQPCWLLPAPQRLRAAAAATTQAAAAVVVEARSASASRAT